MEITYTSHDFPPSYSRLFHGENTLTFTTQELMWSAITVGRANVIDILQHGVYSKYEILYRASILFANLSLSEGELYKSSAYEHLDPSEKSAVSYFLGLTFTKLLSSKLLNIPWLLHIDIYRNQFEENGQAFGFGSSRVRPDLIGLDINQKWIVMEAKGRTNTMEAPLLEKAKDQTRNLEKIGSDEPELRVAVVTHFRHGKLFVDWADPEKANESSFDIKTSKEEFIKNYYKSVFGILSSNKVKELGDFETYEFSDLNIIIGLDKNIYNTYEKQQYENIVVSQELSYEDKPLTEEKDIPPKKDADGEYEKEDESEKPVELMEKDDSAQNREYDFFMGNDGILIGLGQNWSKLLKDNKPHKK